MPKPVRPSPDAAEPPPARPEAPPSSPSTSPSTSPSPSPSPLPAAAPSTFALGPALDRIRDREALLIYMHDNPDPDALAAAVGLKRLLDHELGLPATLALGGIVGRAENRAMVEALGIPLLPIEELDHRRYDCLAIVDSQPGTGNNSLPADRQVDIVIDHHPLRADVEGAVWCDIRPELGATSTIVLGYLRERQVPVDAVLATGLFYALRTETRDLGREATEAERTAYLDLVHQVDHKTLFRISHPKVPREHFRALDRALRSAQVWGPLVAVNLGALSYPDLVAELADLLLSFEGASFVLCCGRYGQRAFLSLRTDARESRAGTLMRQTIANLGAAGGHGTMAGGRLHQPFADDAELDAVFQQIVQRFLASVGVEGAQPVPLVEA
jgi:nanoRNase/pAp phosphatase (c-di-AMP/oligoRNAs hydrolase)